MSHGEQLFGRFGEQAKAIDHLYLQGTQFSLIPGAGNALIKHQALLNIRQIVIRNQCRRLKIDLGRAAGGSRVEVVPAGFKGLHRALQQVTVEAETDLLNLAALLISK